MVVNDLLGPARGPEEELDQREDRVTGRYLVGILAPKSAAVEAGEQDTLGTDDPDDPEVGATDASTPPESIARTGSKPMEEKPRSRCFGSRTFSYNLSYFRVSTDGVFTYR
jgi:hypothetical protein